MEDFQTQFNNAMQAYATQNQFGVSLIPAHAHTGADSLQVSFNNLANLPTQRKDNGNSGTALTLDFVSGNCQALTLTGNCTLTFLNTKPAGRYLLELKQDGTGSRTVTFPSEVKWSGGVAPTLTTTASKTDIITLYFNGTSYVGAYTLNYTL